MTSSSLALSPRVLAWMPHKPCTTNVVALAPIRHTGGDARDVESESHSAPMSHVLTHWVSQLACLHLTTPLSELLRTDPHRHPFNASASCRGNLLRFGRPDSSGISEPISVPSMWFTTLDDIKMCPLPNSLRSRCLPFHCHFRSFYCSVQWMSKDILLLCRS